MAGGKLEKLLAQKAVLDARIEREQNREKAKQRKADTRRKILAGAAVLDEAQHNPKHKAQLHKLLGRFLTRADDRALFGLKAMPQGKKAKAKDGKAEKSAPPSAG